MCAPCWVRGRASSTAGWIMRLSAFRFLYLLLGEVSVSDGKRQVPPLLFPPRSLRALSPWRHLLRERRARCAAGMGDAFSPLPARGERSSARSAAGEGVSPRV